MPKTSRITIASVCEKMMIKRPMLEAWIRSGKCPFGEYIREEGKSIGSFYIHPGRFAAYHNAADLRPICPYAREHPHP
jgi:hypothetical protein